MSEYRTRMRKWLSWGAVGLAWSAAACGPVAQPEPGWPPLVKKWYERADAGFRTLDTEDATIAIGEALKLEPQREEVRELAARIALSALDFDAAVTHTEGLNTVGGRTTRARALWYAGRVSEALEVLEVLLADPEVRDPWAQGVVALARSGHGRHPFELQGALLAVMEMPRLDTTAMVVPMELNGNPVLALVSTTSTELYVDAAAQPNPEWVTLRFGERLEVNDVPALSRDLSVLSREVGAPIKVVLGTNVLRHLNATVDYMGRQFVVRQFAPPAPPAATPVSVQNVRGGAMVVRSQLSGDPNVHYALIVDTTSPFSVVLDEPAWGRTGVAGQLAAVPGRPDLKQALLPRLQFGGVSVPNVLAVSGVSIAEAEAALDIELDGSVGAGLLNSFRITVTDGGRVLWLEDGPFTGFGAPPLEPSDEGFPPEAEGDGAFPEYGDDSQGLP